MKAVNLKKKTLARFPQTVSYEKCNDKNTQIL